MKTVQAIVIWMVFATVMLLGGCATTTFLAVYRSPDGASRLLKCHWEYSPNDQERLYCHDDDRGVW